MITVENTNGHWTVTLNRPDKANALTEAMLGQLRDAARAAHQDPELRVFILTGAGERVFCAGADMSSTDDMHSFTRAPVWTEMSNAIAALPCLSIAALNGTVAGGGFAAALACDIRICTPHTKFFYPVLKRGFLPQPADVRRLADLIGTARAKMILMAGQKLTAPEALACGLTDAVLPLADFPEKIAALTTDAMAATPARIAAINRLFTPKLTTSEINDCYRAAYDKDQDALKRLSNSP
jgi:enoyl-CoA hydratase/carnithine racemase